MNDILKCNGVNCDKRDSCLRYVIKANNRQSYGMFEPICRNENGYYFYVETKEEDYHK